MTIKEKILTFLDSKGVRKADFFESIGIAPSNFKGSAKQTELGGDKIAKILTAFPELSAEWLLRGEGEMERVPSESQTKEQEEPSQHITDSNIYIKDLNARLDRKDDIIGNLREDIGRLKARIEQLEREVTVQTGTTIYAHSPTPEAVET